MDLTGIGRERVDVIHLALDTVQWRAVVKTVMKISIKCVEFLDLLSDYQLLKKDSVPWS
jgi:hypothetical protein